ncbi:MAG: DUF1801 domain-containing protein [Chloroflexi bacterium]|nr:DUF1801 domain-containing protein [Chloroflexota bacterium]MCI0645649.1 DUF1801 domain-containing protein [Chloroflexota bacterium]MCI0725561.1 DUF1801 domain-containing protein [Chloroflexota bacterium]
MPTKQMHPELTSEQFLAGFPPPIQELAQELRLLVRQAVPNVIEAVYPGWRLIGYRVPDKERSAYFGFIAPAPERVFLGFEYGVLLPDPHHLLQGDGRQVRQVVVEQLNDIRPQEFTALISRAAEIALAPKEKKQQMFLEREEP